MLVFRSGLELMTVEAEIPVPRKLRSNGASLGKAD